MTTIHTTTTTRPIVRAATVLLLTGALALVGACGGADEAPLPEEEAGAASPAAAPATAAGPEYQPAYPEEVSGDDLDDADTAQQSMGDHMHGDDGAHPHADDGDHVHRDGDDGDDGHVH